MSRTIKEYFYEKYFKGAGRLTIDDLQIDQLRFFRTIEKRDPLAIGLYSFASDYNVDDEDSDTDHLLSLEDLELEIKKVSLNIDETIALFKALLEQDIFYGMLIDAYDLNRQLKIDIFSRKILNIMDIIFRVYEPLKMAQENSYPDRIRLEGNKLIVYRPYFTRSEAILFSLFYPVSFIDSEKGEETYNFADKESIKLKVFLYFYRPQKRLYLSTELSKEIELNTYMFLSFLDLERYIDPEEFNFYNDILESYKNLNLSVFQNVIYTYNIDDIYRVSNLPIKDKIISIPITLGASKISVPYYGFVGLVFDKRKASILTPYFTGMMGSPNVRYSDGSVCLGNLPHSYIGNFYVLQDANYHSAYNIYRISGYYSVYLEFLKSALIEILKNFQTK